MPTPVPEITLTRAQLRAMLLAVAVEVNSADGAAADDVDLGYGSASAVYEVEVCPIVDRVLAEQLALLVK